ncbi:MAG TPA: DNA recombination protein RmuC [Burkholderiaceae bacterium]|jgi:DNA recombination protein RmuC
MPFDWILMALLALVLLLLLWITFRRSDHGPLKALFDEMQADIQKFDRGLRDEVARSAGGTRSELAQTLGTFQQTLLAQQGDVARTQNEQIDSFRIQLGATQQHQADALQRFSQTLAEQLRALSQSNDVRLNEVRTMVEAKLSAIQADNEKKLEQVRATVDEKLHATLEQRLGESFKQVADRLDQVHRGLGEMQGLAKDVGSLSRVLNNVKTRGSFGEVQLGALLEEVFTAEQFERNVETIPGSQARVDFALRLPGRRDDGKPLWLPIDAKFPREDYERLLDAQERADPAAAELAAKAIEVRLRAEARTIRDKYIAAPHTADFGILFVPTEGLYAEALRRPGLVEGLQREHKIMLAGPTTLLATLNSLQMGFRTLALEKRSAEVWEVLGAVKTEFGKFGEVLAKTKRKLDEASSTIDAAQTRTNVMTRKLKSVEALSEPQTQLLLPGAEADLADDDSA